MHERRGDFAKSGTLPLNYNVTGVKTRVVHRHEREKNRESREIKRGAFSEMIFLPGEDREQFETLHNALREEWNPQGPTSPQPELPQSEPLALKLPQVSDKT